MFAEDVFFFSKWTKSVNFLSLLWLNYEALKVPVANHFQNGPKVSLKSYLYDYKS